MSIFKKIKRNIIFAPLLFYPVVFGYSWLLFRKDFYVSFPTKNITKISTHFIFILTSRKNKKKYLVKHRNVFSDVYSVWRREVKRLPNQKFIKLLQQVKNNQFAKEIIPDVEIYKGRVLWEYLEHALPVYSADLHLSIEERDKIRAKVKDAVEDLYKNGIIYGGIRKHHVLVEKVGEDFRVVLVDWDTARYVESDNRVIN